MDVSGEGNTAVVSYGVPYAPWKTLFYRVAAGIAARGLQRRVG
ncbi:MAG: hypothetical protein R2715_16625 [Ilumatobacteraceae bacterium]